MSSGWELSKGETTYHIQPLLGNIGGKHANYRAKATFCCYVEIFFTDTDVIMCWLSRECFNILQLTLQTMSFKPIAEERTEWIL